MTFDRNPKPVQFIQPNVLDRAGLSVGKDDGLADQFGRWRHCRVETYFAAGGAVGRTAKRKGINNFWLSRALFASGRGNEGEPTQGPEAVAC